MIAFTVGVLFAAFAIVCMAWRGNRTTDMIERDFAHRMERQCEASVPRIPSAGGCE